MPWPASSTSRTLQQGDDVSTAVTVEYDAAGNVVSAIDPDGRTTTYTYTPDGQPLTKTSPSGTVTTHTYDQASGLLAGITVTAPGQPPRTITFTRVLAGQPGAGQVATVSDGTGAITYGYDVDGRRTTVSYPDGTSTSADYNDKGQLVTTTDVTGAVTTYAYDAADGTLTSATQRPRRHGGGLGHLHLRRDEPHRHHHQGQRHRHHQHLHGPEPARRPNHQRRRRPGARSARLYLRRPLQPGHPHRHLPGGRQHVGHRRHLDHRVQLRRLRPVDRFRRPRRAAHQRATDRPARDDHRLHRRRRGRRRGHHPHEPPRRDPSDHHQDDEHQHDRRLRPADRPEDRTHHGHPDLRR